MSADQSQPARRLLRRDARHAQLLSAATRAFAKDGFAATSLEDVASEAGVTKAIIYRHFDSKTTLYQESLDAVRRRIRERVGDDSTISQSSIDDTIAEAANDPDGYRLLFEHARREPAFRSYSDDLTRVSTDIAEAFLKDTISDPRTRRWVAGQFVRIQTELVLSWLDEGQPVPPARLKSAIQATSQALVKSVLDT
ncbi:MAG TPA: TetR/AcrR family transcriptional regulator [Microbacteriaceae bacterium]